MFHGAKSTCKSLLTAQRMLIPVQVHRGVYVAAEILYERFKPMVEEQLASSPFAKVAFTVSPLIACITKYNTHHVSSDCNVSR